MSKVTISLRIDEELHDLLKASSKKWERSVSETVRLACMAVLKPSEQTAGDTHRVRMSEDPETLSARQQAARKIIDDAYDQQQDMALAIEAQIAKAITTEEKK